MAANLGVELQEGDTEMEPSALTQQLILRAKEAGKSESEINAIIS